MKYEFIVENSSDFLIGESYLIVYDYARVDCFICNSLKSASKKLEEYKARGCEIWRYMCNNDCIILWQSVNKKKRGEKENENKFEGVPC